MDIEDILAIAPNGFGRSTVPKGILEEITQAIVDRNFETNDKDDLKTFLDLYRRKYHMNFTHAEIINTYRKMVHTKRFEFNQNIIDLLRRKEGRGASGVMVNTVFLSAYPGVDLTIDDIYEQLKKKDEIDQETRLIDAAKFTCTYDCDYCPKEPGQPRSYISSEEGPKRAMKNRYDPALQFWDRGDTYINMGHDYDKVELLILGGTWESYDELYLENFIRMIFWAANVFYDPKRAGINKTADFKKIRPIGTLYEEKMANQYSMCKIIGITIETRPDHGRPKNFIRLREKGVTRIQYGVQHTDDDILEGINRQCKNRDYINTAKKARRFCLKFDTHLMPDLPCPWLEKPLIRDKSVDMVLRDIGMFWKMIYHPDYQSDQWKIYPCEIVNWTTLKAEYEKGIHIPYADTEYWGEELYAMYNLNEYPMSSEGNPFEYREYLDESEFTENFFRFMRFYIDNTPTVPILSKRDRRNARINPPRKMRFNVLYILIMYVKTNVRKYVRLNRVIRDIPGTSILGGNKNVNMREILERDMKRLCEQTGLNIRCWCMRCREVKKRIVDLSKIVINEIIYEASDGVEYFIQAIIPEEEILCGFLRLRIDDFAGYDIDDNQIVMYELVDSGMIRELHVYGKVNPVTPVWRSQSRTQHTGLGTRLLNRAIEISRGENRKSISVIAGEGTRVYYRGRGFLDGEYYMVRDLPTENTVMIPVTPGYFWMYQIILAVIVLVIGMIAVYAYKN